MKRVYLIVFACILLFINGNAQNRYNECDSVAKKVTVYFMSGENKTFSQDQKKNLNEFIEWAKLNPLMPIHIIGWADKTGTKFQNARVSLFRARTVRNYLVEHGVDAQSISYRGAGVDLLAKDMKEARRADVCAKVILSLSPKEDIEKKSAVIPSDNNKNIKSNVIANEQLPVSTDNLLNYDSGGSKIVYSKNNRSLSSTRFYAGAGAGLSFAKSTLQSLSEYGNYAGHSISVFGGYRINANYSVELFMKYTRLKMYSSKDKSSLYADINGNIYESQQIDIDSYSFKNLKSDCRVFSLGTHFNINLVPFWNSFSRWSVLIMPFINGVYNRSNIINNGNRLYTRTNYHFALGVDVGGEYQLNDFIALRVTTGMNYITGASIDGLSKKYNKTNYIWNSFAHIIFNY